MKRRHVLLLVLVPMLAACARRPWKRDPDVQAAHRDCDDLPEGERYTCIERHAVEALNPHVCRVVSKWIDDMCLQAVYQAADDPKTCEQLYLKGVRPTCRDYYRRPAVDFATDATLSVGGEPGRQTIRYQVVVTHRGNRPVEHLSAWLVFPEADGLAAQVQLQRTESAPAELVKPNHGRVYEGQITWETARSKEEVDALLDQARIRLAWTFEGERQEEVFPLSTGKRPNVFPSPTEVGSNSEKAAP